jgi:hypothetical protein
LSNTIVKKYCCQGIWFQVLGAAEEAHTTDCGKYLVFDLRGFTPITSYKGGYRCHVFITAFTLIVQESR